MMRLLIYVFVITACISCSDEEAAPGIGLAEECESPIGLGLIPISTAITEFIPDSYWSMKDSLVFQNNNGLQSIFYFDRISNLELGPEVYEKYCVSDSTKLIRNVYDYEQTTISYSNQNDSLRIRIILDLYNNSKGYANAVEISLSTRSETSANFYYSYGLIKYASDENSTLTPTLIDGFWRRYDFESELMLMGKTYTDVYVSEDVTVDNTQIFYTQKEGIIAYKDQHQEIWVLNQ